MAAKIVGGMAFNCETRAVEFVAENINVKSKKHHFNGYDGKAKYQLVVQGHLFIINATNTDGLELEPDHALRPLIGNEWGYGVDSTVEMRKYDRSVDYCLVATARSPGTGSVVLKNEKTGAVVDKIEIEIVSEIKKTVRIWSLNDDFRRVGLHRSTQAKYPFLSSRMQHTINRVNDIVFTQTGVSLTFKGPSYPLDQILTGIDFGDKPNLDMVQLKIMGMAGFVNDATWHIVWIWDSNEERDVVASTKANITFMLMPRIDGVEQHFIHTVAHEFIHHCCGSKLRGLEGHDKDEVELMFKRWPSGYLIRRERVKQIIR